LVDQNLEITTKAMMNSVVKPAKFLIAIVTLCFATMAAAQNTPRATASQGQWAHYSSAQPLIAVAPTPEVPKPVPVVVPAPHIQNPIEHALQVALDDYRAGKTSDDVIARYGGTPSAYGHMLELNVARARALPSVFPERYVVVNIPSQTLDLYVDGKRALTMRVITGRPDAPTPTMVTNITTAIYNPYWNVPWEMVRDTYSKRAMANSHYLKLMHMEALDGWGADAKVIPESQVPWKDVAAGTIYQRVRQRPGDDNMMGIVKFELADNSKGIYLHDTPLRKNFNGTWVVLHAMSSGCIRLFDAKTLANALMGTQPAFADTEHRVLLTKPVPIFITYFTAMPSETGLVFYHDGYDADK
jgi:murein L,D-transpeptidase YcbB/YkuD